MALRKELVDLEGLEPSVKRRLEEMSEEERSKYKGIAGNKMVEPVPNYNSTPSEKVIKNENNAWVVLGRDRPAGRYSGYSGKGATGAGSVDIVVGRGSPDPRDVDEEGNTLFTDPNFQQDAARVHVSQRTDIDKNFNLPEGKVGNSTGKSGVGIKGDAVRLVSREGMKLVTGTDNENSQGGMVGTVSGIDLIAGGDDSDLQPIPKGDNLKEALDRIVSHINSLTGIVENFITTQMTYNSAMAGHIHPVPAQGGIPTAPSPTAAAAGTAATSSEMMSSFLSCPSQRINTTMFRMNYLKPIGEGYINSHLNSVN